MATRSTPGRYHTSTPHLPTNILTLNRHDGPDLVQLLLGYSRRRGGGLGTRQKLSWRKYRTGTIFQDTLRKRCTEQQFLQEYFEIFDDLFFMRTLSQYYHVKLPQNPHPTQRRRPADTQTTIRNGKFRGEKLYFVESCIINIYPPTGVQRYTREYLLELLGSLLHEMIHAYLDIYMCVDDKCRLRVECVGKLGHGFVWQDIAYALERASQDKTFLNLYIDLDRFTELGFELSVCKIWKPPSLRRWGFGDDELGRASILSRDAILALGRHLRRKALGKGPIVIQDTRTPK